MNLIPNAKKRRFVVWRVCDAFYSPPVSSIDSMSSKSIQTSPRTSSNSIWAEIKLFKVGNTWWHCIPYSGSIIPCWLTRDYTREYVSPCVPNFEELYLRAQMEFLARLYAPWIDRTDRRWIERIANASDQKYIKFVLGMRFMVIPYPLYFQTPLS